MFTWVLAEGSELLPAGPKSAWEGEWCYSANAGNLYQMPDFWICELHLRKNQSDRKSKGRERVLVDERRETSKHRLIAGNLIFVKFLI